MGKKSATAAEKRHMGKVSNLGCLICDSPAQVHHIRTERIKNHFLTIPLCLEHHIGVFSIHMSKEQFTNIYGSELDLLAQTIEMLG
ncbi:MAG: hypothetical protein GQ532_02300 [Methylomarinum sp.]|nr:hypothetical protein [Methylomarinum sp.]